MHDQAHPPGVQQPVGAERLAFLDAMRACAALAVLLCHLLDEVSSAAYRFRFSVFDLGSCGVTLFFLCSGYVIPVSLARQGSLGRFWVRRLLRLYPLYWLSLALIVGAQLSGLTPLSQALRAQPAPTVLAHLTMLQPLFGVGQLSIVYWTLTFELVFYAIVSLLFALRLDGFSVPILLALIGASALAEVGLPLATHVAVPPAIIGFLVMMFSGRLFYMYGAGLVNGHTTVLVSGAGLGVLVASALVNGAVGGDWRAYGYLATSWVGGYGLFVLLFALRRRTFPATLLFVGQISYSIYLLHVSVITLIPAAGDPFSSVLVWFIATLAVAALAYRFVEQPGMELGRRLTIRKTVPADKDDSGPKTAPGTATL